MRIFIYTVLFVCSLFCLQALSTSKASAQDDIGRRLCDPMLQARLLKNLKKLKKQLKKLEKRLKKLEKRKVRSSTFKWFNPPNAKLRFLPIQPKHLTIIKKEFEVKDKSVVQICVKVNCQSDDGEYFLTTQLDGKTSEMGGNMAVSGFLGKGVGSVVTHRKMKNECTTWKNVMPGRRVVRILASRGGGAKGKAVCTAAWITVTQFPK